MDVPGKRLLPDAYCQMIRDANKVKRLDWARANLAEVLRSDGFDDVIWTDECTVQLVSYCRFCCHRRGEPPRNKPRPKHPAKVHIWAGISMRGASGIGIFDGIMKSELFTNILHDTLLPFLQDVFPNGHRFMQDNDPKHTSKLTAQFLQSNHVNWWRIPAESPDCNPIENLWHEYKEFCRREVKPRTKDELVDGIKQFWSTADIPKCQKYIRHLRKEVPKVIQ